MFSKILIANRGEIACRIIRTARDMGIATVAVYSEADAQALHVRMADEAVCVGPARSAESYLAIDRILAAIKETGADAVHPGYGFLAENADFARRLEESGVTFIGPPPGAIAAMGDKIESKKLAQAVGVNTIPGYLGEIADEEEARRVADDIGYPVMIKASAGGGGKGMRIARDETELAEGLRGARNEARAAFGDDRMLIEKFIEQPRHIEIQVLADSHGNTVHLNERECSIQRRHQKVIEEAPSPFVDAEMRAAMGAQAVKLAQAVDYRSAGTVEFVVGADKTFYFLEMNTRLQVEHPITEMITGLDLVEQMIRVAAGEKLAFGQDDVKLDGWAIEARVYAEDPTRGFLPSIGRLAHYVPPPDRPSLRVDSGVYEGGEVSIFYDPMIAKVIAHGATREEARGRLIAALDAFYIRGLSHNIGFLASVLSRPRFIEGRLTTGFIEEEYPGGYDGAVLSDGERDVLIGVAALIHMREAERAAKISGRSDAGRYRPGADWVVALGDEEHAVTVNATAGGCNVEAAGRLIVVRSAWAIGAPLFEGRVNDSGIHVQIDRRTEGYRLTHGGASAEVRVRTARAAALAARMPKKAPPDLSKYLLSPMPGMVVSIAVAPGDRVKAGEELCVVDAMKMENVLRAERDATVSDVKVDAGDSLAVDQVILEFA